MQRTDAVKWFWPFMGVAALAAATIIALPSFASRAAVDEPQFRMLIKVSAHGSEVQASTPVTIIQVKVKRPVSIIDPT